MPALTIRKFQTRDRDALIELWQTVFPDDPPHNDPVKVIDAKLAVDDLIYIAESRDVAENSELIIGACLAGYDGHRGWLYAVAVSPDHRRSGAGARLIETAVKDLKALGCIKINLQVRSTNAGVVAFYQSLGFAVEDRISMGKLARGGTLQ